MADRKLPQKGGYYWAKGDGYKWYNCIVQVYGDFPFFKINGYDFCNDRRITDICEISEFGNKIKQP